MTEQGPVQESESTLQEKIRDLLSSRNCEQIMVANAIKTMPNEIPHYREMVNEGKVIACIDQTENENHNVESKPIQIRLYGELGKVESIYSDLAKGVDAKAITGLVQIGMNDNNKDIGTVCIEVKN